MEQVSALILAAGEGKRMKSKKAKVLHEICGKSLLSWVSYQIQQSDVKRQIIVIGNQGEQVQKAMGNTFEYALQTNQLGTGHAVMQAQEYIKNPKGTVLVLCGDTPLIQEDTIRSLLKFHLENDHAVTVITAELEDPTGYGRIVRNHEGNIDCIVEERDALEDVKKIKEINSGMYCFNQGLLLESLKKLTNDNSQKEYYLTDTLQILSKEGFKVVPFKITDHHEILGVNDRVQLATAERLMQQRIHTHHMINGVTIVDPQNTYISHGVSIGMDTILYPNVSIEGNTFIGEGCVIRSNTRLVNAVLKTDVEISNSCVLDSTVDSQSKVGPFAYLRPGSHIGKQVKVGDFVEIKNSTVGDHTKISHLTYVGDAIIEKNVNLGCGVVVVNYDGQTKHQTVVKEDAFVGCNVNLISPVVVDKGAYVAAGSTITQDVPEKSLAIARSRQTIKENWVQGRFQKD
jgi:bifunctional UDP-N-acetylglucosamine pyrophosphorylase / glucosamine-1-phosphate N-acetyltransferase